MTKMKAFLFIFFLFVSTVKAQDYTWFSSNETNSCAGYFSTTIETTELPTSLPTTEEETTTTEAPTTPEILTTTSPTPSSTESTIDSLTNMDDDDILWIWYSDGTHNCPEYFSTTIETTELPTSLSTTDEKLSTTEIPTTSSTPSSTLPPTTSEIETTASTSDDEITTTLNDGSPSSSMNPSTTAFHETTEHATTQRPSSSTTDQNFDETTTVEISKEITTPETTKIAETINSQTTTTSAKPTTDQKTTLSFTETKPASEGTSTKQALKTTTLEVEKVFTTVRDDDDETTTIDNELSKINEAPTTKFQELATTTTTQKSQTTTLSSSPATTRVPTETTVPSKGVSLAATTTPTKGTSQSVTKMTTISKASSSSVKEHPTTPEVTIKSTTKTKPSDITTKTSTTVSPTPASQKSDSTTIKSKTSSGIPISTDVMQSPSTTEQQKLSTFPSTKTDQPSTILSATTTSTASEGNAFTTDVEVGVVTETTAFENEETSTYLDPKSSTLFNEETTTTTKLDSTVTTTKMPFIDESSSTTTENFKTTTEATVPSTTTETKNYEISSTDSTANSLLPSETELSTITNTEGASNTTSSGVEYSTTEFGNEAESVTEKDATAVPDKISSTIQYTSSSISLKPEQTSTAAIDSDSSDIISTTLTDSKPESSWKSSTTKATTKSLTPSTKMPSTENFGDVVVTESSSVNPSTQKYVDDASYSTVPDDSTVAESSMSPLTISSTETTTTKSSTTPNVEYTESVISTTPSDFESTTKVTTLPTEKTEKLVSSTTPYVTFQDSETTESSTFETTENPTQQFSAKSSTEFSTTPEPSCENACPWGYFEGDYACFKFIHSNISKGWNFNSFQKACTSDSGIIASLLDFVNSKNFALFKKMKSLESTEITVVFTNAVSTLYFRTSQMIPSINMSTPTDFPIVTEITNSKRYNNVSAICRVGKHCQRYDCPIREYFMPPFNPYLVTKTPPTTVLKVGQNMKLNCLAFPNITHDIRCDRRGYLYPDSSMITCEPKKSAPSPYDSEVDGLVSVCGECDPYQTRQCKQQLAENGTAFKCICKEHYGGRTCKFPLNACANISCDNGGDCINKFDYGYCLCKPSFYGEMCQFEYYNGTEASWFRTIANTIVYITVGEQAVRTQKRAMASRQNMLGNIPTEICRTLTVIFGSMAFLFRIFYEFPESDQMRDKLTCVVEFCISITFVFFSLTAMIAESIFSLGIITNKTTNYFESIIRKRENCVQTGKFFFLFTIFGLAPSIVCYAMSWNMVTPHSCVGTLPWEFYSKDIQFSGVVLVFLLSLYALTASGIGFYTVQFVDIETLETRRRFNADSSYPHAYGNEVLPVEINVKYWMLALRPLLFTITWFSFIISTELFVPWAIWFSTICNGFFSVFSFVQVSFTIGSSLQDTLRTLMLNLPEKWAPKFDYVSMRSRNDYLKFFQPKKYEKEQAKLRNGGPVIRFPIEFDQDISKLSKTDKINVRNVAAFRNLIPSGIKDFIFREWTLKYLQERQKGEPRWKVITTIRHNLLRHRYAAPEIQPASFDKLFNNFWENMGHSDRLGDNNDAISKKIFAKGVKILDSMKLSEKVPLSELWDARSSDNTILTFVKNDPLITSDKQQQAYYLLENLCQNITFEQMVKDEAVTKEYREKYPYLCGQHRDKLNALKIDNRLQSLMDFMLDEKRPNFIGPRTIEKQLPPGITPLIYTGYYWSKIGNEIWKKLLTRAQYEAFNIAANEEHGLLKNYLPWNFKAREEFNPNLGENWRRGELHQPPSDQ